MKVLVIGSGGREHALVWKLAQSASVSKIWCIPGNGGISQQAECLAGNLGDVRGLADLAEKLGADLTVVGPEQPLVDGISDEFERRGLRIVGPSSECARLEGSKIFAKEFLNRHGIPTAQSFGTFSSAAEAIARLKQLAYPLVLKADGLCAGKGVLVAKSCAEAADFADRVLEKKEFGDGAANLLLEEALEGDELSFIVLSDGDYFVPLVATRDHKRAFDGDQGPNTGGMGAYSCDGIISETAEKQILKNVVQPTMDAFGKEGWKYRGFLYFGLMLTSKGPKVLEFNCRLGDPETQAIIPRIDSDLGDILMATAQGQLRTTQLKWRRGASICVVMASGGYPGKYDAGQEIHGLEKAGSLPDVMIFHAGTRREGTVYYTSSGRVLGVTALGDSLELARHAAYDAVRCIDFAKRQYRSDIALVGCRSANAGEA
jgi:phosphoribosylamine---glycine ligase